MSTATWTPLVVDREQDHDSESRIYYDVFPAEQADALFWKLKNGLQWGHMYHQTGQVPRLVCCQSTVSDDGSQPVYRHPSDRMLLSRPWTAAPEQVRRVAEAIAGHPLNHALIQLYRGGEDYISEHSDKTLDIVPGTFIVNVSFGAQRTMRLRTKREASTSNKDGGLRTTCRVPLPHNSLVAMSLTTNARYLHGIRADKRPSKELLDAERSYEGERISLTFRHIGTYISADESLIWGHGAKSKTKEDARLVINADHEESSRLLQAFGLENQLSHVAWDAMYGEGFDVLHIR